MTTNSQAQSSVIGRKCAPDEIRLASIMSRLSSDDRLSLGQYVSSSFVSEDGPTVSVFVTKLRVKISLEVWTIDKAYVYIITSGSDVNTWVLLPVEKARSPQDRKREESTYTN